MLHLTSTFVRRSPVLLTTILFGVVPAVAPLYGEEGLPSVSAVATNVAHRMVDDVRLTSEGQLTGLLVDTKGHGLAHESIELRRHDAVLMTTTAIDGRFIVENVVGGTYEILYLGDRRTLRVWTPQAAPPLARNRLLLAAEDTVVRGQQPLGEALLSDPILLGGVLTGIVAVPIIVHNAKDNASASGP